MNKMREKHYKYFAGLTLALLVMFLVIQSDDFVVLGIYGLCLFFASFYIHLRVIEDNEEFLKPEMLNLVAFIFIYGFTGIGFLIYYPEQNAKVFMMILLAWIALNSGLYWGRALTPLRSHHINKNWQAKKVDKLLNVWLFVHVLSTVLYFYKMGEIPILSDIPEEARVILADKGGGYLRTIVYSSIVWIMLAYTALKTGAYKRFWLFVSVCCFYMVVFFALGNRAPMITILFMMLLMKVAYDNILQDVKWYHVVCLSAIIATIGLVFGLTGTYRVVNDKKVSQYREYQQLISEGDYFTIFTDQIGNYVSHGVRNFDTVYKNVPENFDYRYGATYLYPLETILPGKQYTLDMKLKDAFNMGFSGGGFVPSMLGEAYVNFGKAGIVIVPFLIGFLLSSLYVKFKNSKISAQGLLYLFLLYYLSVHMVSGILASSVFVMEAVVLILLFDMIVTKKRNETE